MRKIVFIIILSAAIVVGANEIPTNGRIVIPAQAGIQNAGRGLDSHLRGNYGQLEASSEEGERSYFKNIRQLKFEGINAEAYFSRDMEKIIFQSIRGDHPYYQIYTMDIDGSHQALIGGNKGKTTCSYFSPDGKKIIYASTMHNPASGTAPPPKEERKYQWDFDPDMEIYEADPDGSNLRRLTNSDGYDAEGVYSNDGTRIVFTSQRDGDLEIYVMNADGANARRITESKGYDGGAFFSPDDKEIVLRAFRDPEKSGNAKVFITGEDGKGERRVTSIDAVNWAPYFHPSGKYIIYASNPDGHGKFDLYIIKPDGTGLKRITYDEGFDGLPVFSPDGKRLLWTSTRVDGKSQLFIADWIYE